MAEEWRAIPGHPGYEASDEGRIRSWVLPPNRARRAEPKILRIQRFANRRYPRVALGRDSSREVHVYVALAFLGSRPDGMVIRHLDGDSYNNRPSNLAYGTQSGCNHDKVRHGTDHLSSRTHCKNNHEFTEKNTYRDPRRPNARVCRECRRAADARRSPRPPRPRHAKRAASRAAS